MIKKTKAQQPVYVHSEQKLATPHTPTVMYNKFKSIDDKKVLIF